MNHRWLAHLLNESQDVTRLTLSISRIPSFHLYFKAISHLERQRSKVNPTIYLFPKSNTLDILGSPHPLAYLTILAGSS